MKTRRHEPLDRSLRDQEACFCGSDKLFGPSELVIGRKQDGVAAHLPERWPSRNVTNGAQAVLNSPVNFSPVSNPLDP